MTVIAIAFLAHRFAQPVAQVEGELLAVLVAQVALRVVAQPHRRGAAVGGDVAQPVIGVVPVVVFLPAQQLGAAHVVQRVVAVAHHAVAAEGAGGGLGQTLQGVVLHRARARAVEGVADARHVAGRIVVVAVVQHAASIHHAGRKLTGVLGHAVHQPVAVGELLHATIWVVAHRRCVGTGLGRLPQRVGRIVDVEPARIGDAGQRAVGVVTIAQRPQRTAALLQALADQQPALVVAVGVDDLAGAAIVGGHDLRGQAIAGVVPGLVAVAVGEGQRPDPVARVVAAVDAATGGIGGAGVARRGTRQRQAAGAPHQVAGGVVAIGGGTGLRLDGLAHLLHVVVDVATGHRLGLVRVAPAQRQRLAEHIARDLGECALRMLDRHRRVIDGLVEGLVAGQRLLAPRAGHAGPVARQIVGQGRQQPQLAVLRDRRSPAQCVVAGPYAGTERVVGTCVGGEHLASRMVVGEALEPLGRTHRGKVVLARHDRLPEGVEIRLLARVAGGHGLPPMPGAQPVFGTCDLLEALRGGVPGTAVAVGIGDARNAAHHVVAVAGHIAVLVGRRGDPAVVVDAGRHGAAIGIGDRLRHAALPRRQRGGCVVAILDRGYRAVGVVAQRLLQLAERPALHRQRPVVVAHLRHHPAAIAIGDLRGLAQYPPRQMVVILGGIGAVAARPRAGDAERTGQTIEGIDDCLVGGAVLHDDRLVLRPRVFGHEPVATPLRAARDRLHVRHARLRQCIAGGGHAGAGRRGGATLDLEQLAFVVAVAVAVGVARRLAGRRGHRGHRRAGAIVRQAGGRGAVAGGAHRPGAGREGDLRGVVVLPLQRRDAGTGQGLVDQRERVVGPRIDGDVVVGIVAGRGVFVTDPRHVAAPMPPGLHRERAHRAGRMGHAAAEAAADHTARIAAGAHRIAGLALLVADERVGQRGQIEPPLAAIGQRHAGQVLVHTRSAVRIAPRARAHADALDLPAAVVGQRHPPAVAASDRGQPRRRVPGVGIVVGHPVAVPVFDPGRVQHVGAARQVVGGSALDRPLERGLVILRHPVEPVARAVGGGGQEALPAAVLQRAQAREHRAAGRGPVIRAAAGRTRAVLAEHQHLAATGHVRAQAVPVVGCVEVFVANLHRRRCRGLHRRYRTPCIGPVAGEAARQPRHVQVPIGEGQIVIWHVRAHIDLERSRHRHRQRVIARQLDVGVPER